MGRPFTLLEDLCRHALSIGADSIEVEHRDHRDWVYGRKDNAAVFFASFARLSADAKELRDNLYRAHKKPLRTVLDGHVYVLKVRIARRCIAWLPRNRISSVTSRFPRPPSTR